MWTRPQATEVEFNRLALAAVVVVLVAMSAAKEAEGQGSQPPGDQVDLILDDGSVEETGIGGNVLLVNRFSPDEFPIEINRASVLWVPHPSLEKGDPFWIFLYEDEDSDIFNGTVHRAAFQGVVQALDGVTFSNVNFSPVVFDGPGDILIATSLNLVPGFWAPRDTSMPIQLRSYISDWDGEMPPPLPNGNTTGLLLFTNWPIRGEGTVLQVPVTLQSVSVD